MRDELFESGPAPAARKNSGTAWGQVHGRVATALDVVCGWMDGAVSLGLSLVTLPAAVVGA